MKSKYKFIGVLCLSALITGLSQPVFAESESTFGTHGYLRLGSASSDGGATQEVFKAPGAGAKYRLGNENDNYIETTLYNDYKLSGSDARIHTEGMAVISGDQNDTMTFKNMSQLYMEASNFTSAMGGPKIWAGRRYYDRYDIHINDYYFLNTLQGYDGGGISDINVGFGKFAIAAGRGKMNFAVGASSIDFSQTNLDIRLSEIPANENGAFMFWGLYSTTSNQDLYHTVAGTKVVDDNVKGLDGVAVGIMHIQKKILGGTNKFMIQYGKGLARNAGQAGIETYASSAKADDLKKAETWRVTEQMLMEPTPVFSMMACFVYEDKKSVEFDGIDQRWISLGARPIYFVNNFFRVPFEIGLDYVDNRATSKSGTLLKTTLAGEFALKPGFLERPVLRAFVTNAKWSDNFKGMVGGTTYADKTDGWSSGIQIETWW